jgi:hypothetical protein
MADMKKPPLKAVDEQTLRVKPEPIKGLKAVDEKTMKTKSDLKAVDEQTLKTKGTQAGHVVTDHTNHTTTLKSQGAIAEDTLKRDVAAGKVKDLTQERQMIAKKTGVWPNGYTN